MGPLLLVHRRLCAAMSGMLFVVTFSRMYVVRQTHIWDLQSAIILLVVPPQVVSADSDCCPEMVISASSQMEGEKKVPTKYFMLHPAAINYAVHTIAHEGSTFMFPSQRPSVN